MTASGYKPFRKFSQRIRTELLLHHGGFQEVVFLRRTLDRKRLSLALILPRMGP